jgi:hypothetical protein
MQGKRQVVGIKGNFFPDRNGCSFVINANGNYGQKVLNSAIFKIQREIAI